MSSEERLARLETKVDSMQHELSEFKNVHHKDFMSHQAEDDRNFKEINASIASTRETQVAIKTAVETRLDATDKNQRNWGIVVSIISLIVAVIVALK